MYRMFEEVKVFYLIFHGFEETVFKDASDIIDFHRPASEALSNIFLHQIHFLKKDFAVAY